MRNEWCIDEFRRAEDNRCGGVYREGNKNDKGLGTCKR